MASFHHIITIFFIAIISTSSFAITATSQLTFLLTGSPPSTASSVTAAIKHLRKNGYKTLAREMDFHYNTLITFNNLTIFALDDLSIRHYRSHRHKHYFNSNDVMLYIVPNRLLNFQHLQKLPEFSALPTLIPGEFLYITTNNAVDDEDNNNNGGVFSALKATRINYNVIDQPDYFVYSNKVVVHGICLPFVRVALNSSSISQDFDDVRDEL